MDSDIIMIDWPRVTELHVIPVLKIAPTFVTQCFLPSVTYFVGACVTQSLCYSGNHTVIHTPVFSLCYAGT